jgi:hypothetical protein
VDARVNWWGHPSGPGGEGPGLGEEVAGDVLYDPWLPLPDLDYDIAFAIYDAGDIVTWRQLSWVPTTPVTVTVRVGNTPSPNLHWSNWAIFTGLPADLSALPPSRFLEWRVLATAVPDPSDVVISHDPFS